MSSDNKDFFNEKEGDHSDDSDSETPEASVPTPSTPNKKQTRPAEDKELLSYVHIDGDWEDRKISLFGAVKSFISQLKIGQDLTRVSLPCVFCRPYSLLEEVAARNFVHLDILFQLREKNDDLEKMMCVLEWLVSTARQEKFNHKPFNPVIGEVHLCKYDHVVDAKTDDKRFMTSHNDEKDNTQNKKKNNEQNNNDKDNNKDKDKDKDNNDLPDITYLVVEQVKHHPPTCAIRIDNPKREFSLQGYYTFMVQFNRNSVLVTCTGSVNITMGKEEFFLQKAMPDLMIRNVILGSKLVSWEGGLTVECKQLNMFGKFDLSTKGRTNVAKGGVYSNNEQKDVPLAFVEGKCGGPAMWYYNANHPRFADKLKATKEKKKMKKEIEKKKDLAGEPGKRRDILPRYLSREKQPQNSSYFTWDSVRKCIIDNDYDAADLEKQKIEQKQRTMLLGLKEKNQKYEAAYFKARNEGEKEIWEIKDKNWWKTYSG